MKFKLVAIGIAALAVLTVGVGLSAMTLADEQPKGNSASSGSGWQEMTELNLLREACKVIHRSLVAANLRDAGSI